jgi:tRNA dimethylallyltransferase
VSENYVFSEEKSEKSTRKAPPRDPVLKIGIHWDRKVLYDRINARAEQQFEQGLIEETEKILKKYTLSRSALTSFGYREIQDFLDGRISRAEALAANQKRNRNYAKRQLTWWRGREDVLWVRGEDL